MKLLLAAAGAAAVVAAAAGAQTASRPALRVVSLHPITAKGTHFGAREHVQVRFAIGRSAATKQVVATPAGSFVVHDGPESYDPCSNALVVTAIGSRGSHAFVKIPPRMCAPA